MKTQLRTIALVVALLYMGTLEAKSKDSSKAENGVACDQTETVVEDYDLERDEAGNWFDNGMEILLEENVQARSENPGEPEKGMVSNSSELEVEDFDLERDEAGNWIDNGMERLLLESEIFVFKRKLMNRVDSLLSKVGIERMDDHIIIKW